MSLPRLEITRAWQPWEETLTQASPAGYELYPGVQD